MFASFSASFPHSLTLRLLISHKLHPHLHYVLPLIPILNLQVFPHIRPLKLHPYLFQILYPSSCTNSIPICVPIYHNLHPPLNYVPLIIPLLHLHVFPHILPLKLHPSPCILLSPSYCPHHIPLRLPLSHNLHPNIPPHLHSSYINIPHYQLHPNHRNQIIQWIADLMPIFYVSLLWNCGITLKRWNIKMAKWIGTELWWKKHGEMEKRIHTHVHMAKWWYGEIDWYRATVKQVWWNVAQNTHTCSHGEMEIWWNGAVQIIQRWNGLIVKLLYSPSTSVGFLVPSKYGDLYRFFTSSADVSPVEEKVVSEWCRDDIINAPWSAATPFDAVSSWFFRSISLFHSNFHSSHHSQHWGGSSPFAPYYILTFLAVLVLARYN